MQSRTVACFDEAVKRAVAVICRTKHPPLIIGKNAKSEDGGVAGRARNI